MPGATDSKMDRMVQTTLRADIAIPGTGLHSGKPVRMTLRPAPANHGIWFRRTDVTDRDNMIPARYDAVTAPQLCTPLVNAEGVEVSTVEHVMAALAGCGVHNALVEIDAPEVPILDGSSARIVREILRRGLRSQDAPLFVFRVREAIEVRDGDAMARLEPADRFEMDYRIEFDEPAIGTQELRLDLSNGAFVRELCDSRTFCRQRDVEAMRAAGLARGGSYENAVVVQDAEVLSPGGLRHADEFVRHKMLDALGDLALAGAPILGRYTGLRAGHAVTNALLHKLFATPGAVEVMECDAETAAMLPGVGIEHGDLSRVA